MRGGIESSPSIQVSMKTIVLIDNDDIKIAQNYIGGALLTTSNKPKRPITEWTPAYEKRCDHWKQVAKKMTNK